MVQTVFHIVYTIRVVIGSAIAGKKMLNVIPKKKKTKRYTALPCMRRAGMPIPIW